MTTPSSQTDIWHAISMKIPFPTTANARLVKQVVEVDKPLRPSELKRSLEVEDTSLVVTFLARTVAQARVALDHALSDIQLVVQTMHNFGPEDVIGQAGKEKEGEEAPSLEVGLEGSWGSLKRG
ncbi:hypothetical protein JCM5350_005061 [Sporobolomyces pararoseus]